MSRTFIPFDNSYRVPAPVKVSRGVRTSDTLFLCGQMDLNADGQAQNVDDLSAQTRRAMGLLNDVIEKAKMRPSNAVQLHVFYRGDVDEVSYRREILDVFPAYKNALIVLTPVDSYPSEGAAVEIDAIVVNHDERAIVEDESGRVVGARRGEWVFVEGHSTARVLEAQIAEVAARVHRVLQGLRADINDVCRVNAYYSSELSDDMLARAESQLAAMFVDSRPTYHAAVLPKPLPDGQFLRVEVIGLRGTDGDQLESTDANGAVDWDWPNGLPYSKALRRGNFVFLSAQLPVDKSGALCHPSDIAGQTHLVMSHMGKALNALGADFSHMTKVNAYFEGNNNLEDWRINVGIRSDYYVAPGPASTGIEVKRCSTDGALITADCFAVVG